MFEVSACNEQPTQLLAFFTYTHAHSHEVAARCQCSCACHFVYLLSGKFLQSKTERLCYIKRIHECLSNLSLFFIYSYRILWYWLGVRITSLLICWKINNFILDGTNHHMSKIHSNVIDSIVKQSEKLWVFIKSEMNGGDGAHWIDIKPNLTKFPLLFVYIRARLWHEWFTVLKTDQKTINCLIKRLVEWQRLEPFKNWA